MSRVAISRIGVIVAAGFLLASALANYSFGASLGRTGWEGQVYGLVGILAVATNALCPFFVSWSLASKRSGAAAAAIGLWSVCILYSTTSALGFASQNRESAVLTQSVTRDAYDDVRRELLDLEGRRQTARGQARVLLDARIDETRTRLSRLRDRPQIAPDAQSVFLSTLTLGLLSPSSARQALIALFALFVELGATLTLFAALSHSPPDHPPRWAPRS